MAAVAYELEPEDLILGSVTPRIWTPPLVVGEPGPCGCGCALTPETSVGFEVERFAEEIRRPLDPWQRWLAIHALELLPNGWPRFRQVLVLVARQNGKTELLVILSLFWMWRQRVGIVLGTSTKLDYSRESWLKAVKLIRRTPQLAPDIAARGAVRSVNGEQEITTPWDSRYKIAAANETGGRSLTVHRLIEDEIRQHHDYSAHEAADNAMNAVDDAQGWAISNEGDDKAVVLHDLYESAQTFIETGVGDERLGLFAWSAPLDCDLLDVYATAQANPNLGRRIFWANLIGKAQRAKSRGGEAEARYRTEVLCQRVPSIVPKPIDLERWETLAVGDAVTSSAPRFFLDASPNLRSAAIAGATMRGNIPHVKLADYRAGVDWVQGRIKELAEQYPHAIWQYEATGPASALKEALKAAGVEVEKPFNTTDMARGCTHLAKLVDELGVTHSGDDEVTMALDAAVKRDIGDPGLWAWGKRKSGGDITPIVAVTGALWLLELQPAYDVLASIR